MLGKASPVVSSRKRSQGPRAGARWENDRQYSDWMLATVFSPWGQSGRGTGVHSFWIPCPCRVLKLNCIKPWATWPHSERTLLWSGCWEWRWSKSFPPWIIPWSYIFWTSSFPREWKRSPWVLYIKACNLPVHAVAQKNKLPCAWTWSPAPAGTYCQIFISTWRMLRRP